MNAFGRFDFGLGGAGREKSPTDKVFRQTSYKDLKKGLYIPESLSGILS